MGVDIQICSVPLGTNYNAALIIHHSYVMEEQSQKSPESALCVSVWSCMDEPDCMCVVCRLKNENKVFIRCRKFV